MYQKRMNNSKWEQIYHFLQNDPHVYAMDSDSCRQFIEALYWMSRSGAQWRLLPQEYGNWNTVFKRFNRWESKGVFERMHHHFSQDADLEHLMIDSTLVRTHSSASGASKKKHGTQQKQALGRSAGGFTTKIHIAVDALGNPLRFLLTPGEVHDRKCAEALVEGWKTSTIIADRGYIDQKWKDSLKQQGIQLVQPPRRNQIFSWEYDQHVYKERHLVECFISKMKQFQKALL